MSTLWTEILKQEISSMNNIGKRFLLSLLCAVDVELTSHDERHGHKTADDVRRCLNEIMSHIEKEL
jgi:hypothetical protein